MAEPEPGIGVDKFGGGVVDPTKNVLDLVEAAMKRQDDMRDALQKWMEAKFDGIAHEFELVERGRVEQKSDTKIAVDAAFSSASQAVKEQATSAKEAILKSETNAAEQFKQQTATFAAQLAALMTLLTDVKERVGKFETQKETSAESRVDNRASIGLIAVLIGVALSFLMLAAVIIIAVLRGGQ